jgi:hypothetical protein
MICAQSSLFAQVKAPAASPRRAAMRVPFVGCKSDGQMGPAEAPAGKNKIVRLPAEAAQRLAYYNFKQGFGVLAPRGWYCFGTYGSGGHTLYVSPHPIDTARLFSGNWDGFAGPAIEVSHEYGDTSGRFGVASTIARVFPAHREFVRDVIKEGIEPASSFPFGPYPKDKLTYKSKEIVEYETPAQTEGLGTKSWLQKNADPISGVAILLGQTPDLLQLAARLPPEFADLTSPIIQQVERDAAQTQY